MIRILLILLFVTFSLTARENPFSPIKTINIEPTIITTTIKTQPLFTHEKNITKKIEQTQPIKQEINQTKNIEPIKLIPTKTKTISMIKEGKKKIVTITQKKPLQTKHTQHKKKKVHKKRKKIRSKLIYNGRFAKIRLKGNSIKISTQDSMLKHFTLKYPNRLVIDLERFDVVAPFNKKVYRQKVRSLKVGHHDYFYRLTFVLAKNYRYKIQKRSYGYLIKLY